VYCLRHAVVLAVVFNVTNEKSTVYKPKRIRTLWPSPPRTYVLYECSLDKQQISPSHKNETRNGCGYSAVVFVHLPVMYFYTNYHGHGSQSFKHTSDAIIIFAENCLHLLHIRYERDTVTISKKQITNICSHLLNMLLVNLLNGIASYNYIKLLMLCESYDHEFIYLYY